MMESLYLASMPGFWAGMGRLFDFGNTYDTYNQTASPEQADGIGIMMDWHVVTEDLWKAVYDLDPEIRVIETNRFHAVETAPR